jgi:hypothetical protein
LPILDVFDGVIYIFLFRTRVDKRKKKKKKEKKKKKKTYGNTSLQPQGTPIRRYKG